MPSKSIASRNTLLREFTELYGWSLEKAIYSALRVQGGMDNFNYSEKLMLFDLRYRADCNGNPGLAFTVENAVFCPKEEISLNAAFVLQLARSELMSREMALRAEKDFVGLMVTLYVTEDDFVLGANEIYHHSPRFEKCIVQLRHDIWLQELQRNVQNGCIFRVQEGDVAATLGRMKVDKSRWAWTPLSEEEITALGLQTISERGLPGEGFQLLF